MCENLVIVESPAKAKTIEKFLGKDFVVKSSFGHIRDLSKKKLGVNVDGGFEPLYEIPAEKKKIVDELRKCAKGAKHVWLASDEDREGEAIAWHLLEVLGLPLEQTRRIVFHEITKQAILSAIESPRIVNLDLVNAQQARRVLDRLVGFELSPVLWKKVRPQLSAGRVQSVAVRLLVEREREIITFNSSPYWRVVAQFHKEGQKSTFRAELPKRYASEKEAHAVLQDSIGANYTVSNIDIKPAKRYPAAPFTTSTLQQEAGRKLHMSVSQTMSVAQRLYEQGLITYMRTDSVNLSQQAVKQCQEQITTLFGAEYTRPTKYKTNSKGAQEAHEAIRPSYIEKREIEGSPQEKRLYELIWKRTVASQMVPAEIERTILSIERAPNAATFSTTGEVIRFDGFMKLYIESVEDDNNDEEAEGKLPKLTVGEALIAKQVTATERFTQAPSRFNEALLVKRLEELGIGRPSTYAPTISTIINRGYVEKQNRETHKREYTKLTLDGDDISSARLSENVGGERNRLAPTDIGIVVNDYLEQQFSSILDYNFTANVEKEFDRVADGEIAWSTMIGDFYKPFHNLVEEAVQTQASSPANGRVLGVDPKTGLEVKARVGRYGAMVEIAPAKEGDKPKYASLKKGQLIESITLEEALGLFALPRTVGEFEGEELVIGIGRFGPYVRQGKAFTSLGKEDDPYTITLERTIELIVEQREARAAAATPIQTFAEEPDMIIKNGRYGAYIAFGGKNYRIPKGKDAATITLEECRKIVATTKRR